MKNLELRFLSIGVIHTDIKLVHIVNIRYLSKNDLFIFI